MKKYFFILLVIAVLSIWPFFSKGFYQSHDGEWMIIRFTAFHQTLRAGNFPVRFVDRLNNSYGYPVINFLYPLPFYLSEIPKISGFGFVDSVKIIFAFSTLISAAAMFWALSIGFSPTASLTGAIIYLFIPYRFVDLYVRGSIGENLAFSVLPLILGSIFQISKGKKIYFPLLAIFIGLLITSHNVIAAIFLPIFIVLSFLLIMHDRAKLLISYALGILSAAFFWFPALYDLKYVKLSQINVSNVNDHLVSFSRLIIPSWGYGSRPVGHLGFSPQIGIVAVAVLLTALYIQIISKKKNVSINFFLVITTACIFLLTTWSKIIWNTIPAISVIQFPWRLLSVIVFISSFCAAFVIDSNKRNKTLLATLLISASVISTIVYTKPSGFVNRGEGYYTTNEGSTTVLDEYLPLWVQENPKGHPNQKIEVENGKSTLTQVAIKPNNYKFTLNASEETKIKVNTIFFPGWKVFANGNPIKIDYKNPEGLIKFKLPKGNYDVIIRYTKTLPHLVSEIVSLFAVFSTGLYFFLIKWRKLGF